MATLTFDARTWQRTTLDCFMAISATRFTELILAVDKTQVQQESYTAYTHWIGSK